MYICVCHKITDKYLNDMIKESKITTVKNFCLNTEIGITCGRCLPTIEEKLKENNKLQEQI